MVLAFFFEIEDHSEIDNGGLHGIQIDDDVLRFDVPMNDVPFVALQQTLCDADHDRFDVFDFYFLRIVNDGHEFSTR
jgi:hypothetical protein